MEILLAPGTPAPLGISKKEKGLNFALYSSHSSQVTLLIYPLNGKKPLLEVSLSQENHKTGPIWHIELQNLPKAFDYGYQVDQSPVVLDPYAKALNTPLKWDKGIGSPLLGRWEETSAFDWEEDHSPALAFKDLVIYEMHVRGLSIDSSSHVKHKGSYLAVIEKIPYFKSLGINAVELLPIFEFDECENRKENPKNGKPLHNYWGYSTVNYFCPMKRMGSSEDVRFEFKTMVRELHKHQIEVILDVVYNHTAEGDAQGRTLSLRGIDAPAYYMINSSGEYLDFTGCGNTICANEPPALDLILDSLRYWVEEMHVDGFRFDLASAITRNREGHPLADPPLFSAIATDPILKECKIIVEAWDANGLYQVGSFPSYQKFAEWNGKYRDVVRRFIKGTNGQSGAFATALCGSQDLYGKDRKPFHSINFITAHDGFSLIDLVSYNEKHNLENGEENRDGMNDNESWNCGFEGPSKDANVIKLRERQMRNFMTALLVSIGTPMILMGDEYGHTSLGNNNTWCQDNALNWFSWKDLKKNGGFFRFFQKIVNLRSQEPLLRRAEFLSSQDVSWHGTLPNQPNWSDDNRFVAYTLQDPDREEPLYIAFNADHTRKTVTLPTPPTSKQWFRLIDTAMISPLDFQENAQQTHPLGQQYQMEAHSSIVLKAY